MKWIEPTVFAKSCGNPDFRSIFGHQRAKNAGTNTKIDRGPETYPISINPRDEMNWTNSFSRKVAETLSTDGQMDGRTDRHQGESSIPPFHLRWSGGIITPAIKRSLHYVLSVPINSHIFTLPATCALFNFYGALHTHLKMITSVKGSAIDGMSQVGVVWQEINKRLRENGNAVVIPGDPCFSSDIFLHIDHKYDLFVIMP